MAGLESLKVYDFYRQKDAAFLVGGGFAVYLAWVVASWLGFVGGLVIKNPARYGLDFTFTACFTALLVGFWKDKKDILPWAAAALISVTTSHWVPGKWYILIGALIGSLIGALRNGD